MKIRMILYEKISLKKIKIHKKIINKYKRSNELISINFMS
jgi:hypothetical protein